MNEPEDKLPDIDYDEILDDIEHPAMDPEKDLTWSNTDSIDWGDPDDE